MGTLTLPQIFFGFVFILLLFMNWILFKSIIHPLIFGAIMAGAFAQVNQFFIRRLKGRRQISSIITCIIILLVVILPCLYILIQLSRESIELYKNIKEGLSREAVNNFLFGDGYAADLLSTTTGFFGIEISMTEIENKILSLAQGMSGQVFQLVNGIFGNLISFSFNFLLMLLTTYSLLLEGHKLRDYLLKLSPLPDHQEMQILNKFNQMNYVTLVCNGVGGLIQGFLAAAAFGIFGIQNIFLWFVFMVILAFIPLLGISVITIPASIYLVLIGETTKGLILFIWCTSVALVVENWFKPMFIGKKIQINSLLVLFYIIGGMAVFGMAGIFYGPLICVIFMTIVEIYHDQYTVEP